MEMFGNTIIKFYFAKKAFEIFSNAFQAKYKNHFITSNATSFL